MESENCLYRFDEVFYSNFSSDDYGDHYYPPTVKVHLYEFNILNRTECCFYIEYLGQNKKILFKYKDGYKPRKQFAWETKDEAIISFIKRKESQIRILKSQLRNAEIALDLGKDLKEKLNVNE